MWVIPFVLIYVTVCAIYDARTWQVPNWLTLPGLFMALAYRELCSPSTWLPAAVGGVFLAVAWDARFFKGGDAKVLMALWAVWPVTHRLRWCCVQRFPRTIWLACCRVPRQRPQVGVSFVRHRHSRRSSRLRWECGCTRFRCFSQRTQLSGKHFGLQSQLLVKPFKEDSQMINKAKAFIHDEQGDMAEKGVVLAVIILAALAMWQLLGSKIASWVSRVAGSYN